MPDELQQQIEENAKQPRRASADGVEAEQHPLRDQIEADRYLESKNAMRRGRGFRISKLVPPGA